MGGVTNLAQIEIAPDTMTPSEKKTTELTQDAIRKYVERQRQQGNLPPGADFESALKHLDQQLGEQVEREIKLAFTGLPDLTGGSAARIYDSTPEDLLDSLEEDHIIITVSPSGERVSLDDEDDDQPTIDQQLDLSDLYL